MLNRIRYYIKGLAVVLPFTFYLLPSTLTAASWPMFRNDIQRRGGISEVAYPASSPEGWSFELQGGIIGSPAVKDDIVYFGARDGSVWSFDALSGEVIWQYSTSGFVDSTPTVWENYIYVFSRDGNIYCFKRRYLPDEDCLPLWSYDTESSAVSSPLVFDGKVVVLSGPKLDGRPEGYIYIIDALTGALIRKRQLGAFSYGSAAFGNNRVYFASNNGTISCYDINQDNFIWSKKLMSTMNYSALALESGVLYCYSGDIDRRLYAINSATGYTVWVSSQLSKIATDNTSVSFYDGKILLNIYPTSIWETSPAVLNSSQSVLCYSVEGNLLWRKDFLVSASPKDSYGVASSPGVVGDVAYIGTYNGDLYALSLGTGGVLAKYQFDSPIVCSPAISNGWIYFGTAGGKFYGVKADKILAIKTPDAEDAVINYTPVTVVSSEFENEDYLIQFSKDGTNWTDISTGTIVSGTTTLFDWNTTSLMDGDYTIRQILVKKPENFAANKIIIDNSPLPPTGITALLSDENKIVLRWTKSLDDGGGNNDVVSYEIYKSTSSADFQDVITVSAGTVEYADTVTEENTYYYKIAAVDRRSKSSPTKLISIYAGSPTVAVSSSAAVTPEAGGSVKLESGGKVAEVVFEAGSVDEAVTVTISIPSQYDTRVPSDARGTGVVYEIKLSKDIGLKKPVGLKIKYTNADVLGLNKEKLRIYWYDEKNKKWLMVDSSKSVLEENLVEAKLWKFSLFRVMEFSPSFDDILKDEYVYTFPSPARGDEVNFKFLIYRPAVVKVSVYNVAGEIIWESKEYDVKEIDVGKVQRISWNIRNIATGMYLYKVEARSADKTKRVIKKMAIIH